MMKKVVITAMVGTALVAGYSYGSSTNPAMIDIATTTTTTTAAYLVRGGVSNSGDAASPSQPPDGPCMRNHHDYNSCMSAKGCYWYPHWGSGGCTECAQPPCGVICGWYRAPNCFTCPYYESTKNEGGTYCSVDCKWHSGWHTASFLGECEPK